MAVILLAVLLTALLKFGILDKDIFYIHFMDMKDLQIQFNFHQVVIISHQVVMTQS